MLKRLSTIAAVLLLASACHRGGKAKSAPAPASKTTATPHPQTGVTSALLEAIVKRCQMPQTKTQENFFVVCYGVQPGNCHTFAEPYVTTCTTPGKNPHPKASVADCLQQVLIDGVPAKNKKLARCQRNP